MVDRALQEKQQKIVQAEGEATAAQMLGEAISKNPGYLKLRKLRASGNIAKTVSVAREIIQNLTAYHTVCYSHGLQALIRSYVGAEVRLSEVKVKIEGVVRPRPILHR